ncbi:uncharacterized protein [Antedon mediterranea]|uniref:uncharacterized protein n=1 Tax=Antedon mediterranea TaxID=105859 RepID=UPI003AF6DA39
MSQAGSSVSRSGSHVSISHARARADLAMAKARVEFAKKKVSLLRIKAIAEADVQLLNAEEDEAVCQARADSYLQSSEDDDYDFDTYSVCDDVSDVMSKESSIESLEPIQSSSHLDPEQLPSPLLNKVPEYKPIPPPPLFTQIKDYKPASPPPLMKFAPPLPNLDQLPPTLLKKKLCRNCLTHGHFVSLCPKNSFCKNCTLKHSGFLHTPKRPVRADANATAHAAAVPTPDQSSSAITTQLNNSRSSMAVNGNATRVGLAVVPVKVRCPGTRKTIKTYAFLDNGSTATFCTDALAHKLNAKGKRVQLKLTTVNGQSSSECNLISLEISTLNGDAVFTAPNVHTKPKLPVLKSAIATIDDIKNWVHLEGVNIDTIDANVDLLIGGDLPELHQPYEVKPAMNGGPYATRTALGWVVNGPLTSTRCQVQNCNFICAEPLEEQFKQFCNIEFNNIPTEKTVMSRNDLQALQMMQASTKFKNGHYQVSMPWKSPPEEFPNNKAVALKRLNLLKSRLIKDSTLHTKYTQFMNDLLLKGYAEKALQKDQPRWYLPHHPVLNPQKPGKVRVVFDGSAKYQGVCLNDKLYQGPDLTNTLVGVLLRFRLGPIAFAADIEKMFYQVKVGETDSHYLSHLWWEDGNLNMNPQEYQMVVHLFGGKSSPSCSNFALRKVAKDHADDFDPVVTNAVNNNF